MGKQQPPPANSPAMSAPPRRRKKKGRPSLLDLQKRSLRLEKLHEPLPPPPPQNRRGTRRNPNPSPGSGDDAEAEEGGRREKKLRLVMCLPDESAKGEKTGSARKATDGLQGVVLHALLHLFFGFAGAKKISKQV